MSAKFRTILLILLLAPPAVATAAPIDEILVSLCDPAKLATLGERGANARVHKIVFWLEAGRREGESPEALMRSTMHRIGWDDARGELTMNAMLRNLEIATRLGCTDEEGMSDMRRGRCPTVRNGSHAGDELSVDHIVPRAKYPQFDNVLANLEFMPLSLNRQKGATFGHRQAWELSRFEEAGLIATLPQDQGTPIDARSSFRQ
jgi:hypothetical protein